MPFPGLGCFIVVGGLGVFFIKLSLFSLAALRAAIAAYSLARALAKAIASKSMGPLGWLRLSGGLFKVFAILRPYEK